jgi:hypothetical protein
MPILPTARDDNGHPLWGHGRETFTARFENVGDSGTPLSLAVDVKEALIHIEGAREICRVTGTAAGSVEARLTADGHTLSETPLAAPAGAMLCRLAAPPGTAINVSIIAWR